MDLLQESRRRLSVSQEGFWLCVLVMGIGLYVSFAISPSHYAAGLQLLGINVGPFLGTARSIRSDEWIVLTPLFQTAVLGGFGSENIVSPYHESLKGFFALPISDWSLVFKPQLWGFWIMAPAYAYSLYFAVMWGSFLAGYTILFRQIGIGLTGAVFGSSALFFSHFVQVWWTSNAPTFAFSAWPLVAFLLPIRPVLKAIILFWVCAVWIFGLVYPPFIVSMAFVLVTVLVTFRRDAITKANIIAGLVAMAFLAAVFALYYGNLITVMSHTVYPGQRSALPGTLQVAKVVAHLFPYFNISGFKPLIPSNECEVAVVSTLLPLIMLCFVRYRSLWKAISSNPVLVVLPGIGLGVMLSWMILPIPQWIGKLLLWTLVPPERMAWGFGVLLFALLVAIASKCEFSASFQRLHLFASVMLGSWLISKIGYTEVWSSSGGTAWSVLKASTFEIASAISVAVVVVFLNIRKTSVTHAGPFLLAAALSGAVTFGTFNPVQRTHVIFDVPRSDFIEQVRKNAKENPNGWAVVPGMYGALFSGVGVSAINHTLTAPQLEFFSRMFPEAGHDDLNAVFNRYAHIIPMDVEKPYSPQGDVVVVPIAPFLKR